MHRAIVRHAAAAPPIDFRHEPPGTTIGQFRRNSVEVVRATIQEFKGRRVLDLRAHIAKPDGRTFPTPKGLTIGIEQLPALLALVTAAASIDSSANRGTSSEAQDR